VPITKLTPEMVRTWFARLSTGPVYRSHAYQVLRTIMRTAVEDRLVETSPCVLRNTAPRRSGEITLPTLDELGIIVDNTPDHYRLLVSLAAWCALRFGELAELRRKDLDLGAGVIRVRRGVTWVNGQAVVGPPKSSAGVRDISIPPHLLPAVRDHLNVHAGPDLLFPSATGRQLRHQNFWPYWKTARQAANRPGLHVHHLRHLGAVLAAQSGAPIKELMARLGHSSPAMALVYQHAAAGRAPRSPPGCPASRRRRSP
jgi:integrase